MNREFKPKQFKFKLSESFHDKHKCSWHSDVRHFALKPGDHVHAKLTNGHRIGLVLTQILDDKTATGHVHIRSEGLACDWCGNTSVTHACAKNISGHGEEPDAMNEYYKALVDNDCDEGLGTHCCDACLAEARREHEHALEKIPFFDPSESVIVPIQAISDVFDANKIILFGD